MGCGHGASTIHLARTYPASRVTGFDPHDRSVDTARKRAADAGVSDRVEFEQGGASTITGSYDLIAFFDCLHDLGDPVGALATARSHLNEDGTILLVEPMAGDQVEDNLNPVGAAYYALSTLLCTPNALSQERELVLGAQAGEASHEDRGSRGRPEPVPPGGRDPVQPGIRGSGLTHADPDGGPRGYHRLIVDDREWGFRTRAVHAGNRPDSATGARAVPIYQTTSFVFEDAADAADLFALQKYGLIYSRIANPTVACFEERLASLEGGIGAVATASGMSAEALLFTAVAGAGDHIVSSAALYGGTRTLLEVTLGRLGIETTFVAARRSLPPSRPPSGPTPKLLYTEVVGNPSGIVADLAALADVAHAEALPLAIDSTVATPYLCRPFEHGADIVVHSATKFIGGHGTSLGGVIVESGRFDWGSGRFPTMTEPVASYGGLRFWENFGEYGFCTKLRVEQLRDLGPALSPFNAFLLLQGTETLALRMDRHVANAPGAGPAPGADHPPSPGCRYAGLPEDPQHQLAQRYLPRGAGAVFAFGVQGGRAAGAAFIEATQLCSHLANIGDTRTLVIHPASTTHQQLSPSALLAAGAGADLVRISVGLEDLDDILWDLDQALTQAAKLVGP